MIVFEAAVESLEFDAVRAALARLCATPMGEALALSLRPHEDPRQAEEALAETAEARDLLEEQGRPPIRLPADPGAPLARLAISGTRLGAVEILLLVRLCAVATAARRALARRNDRWPRLAGRAGALPDLEALVALIEPHLSPSGEIADTASPDLRRLRRRGSHLAARVRAILESILRRDEGSLSDQFVTERGGRYVLPVRAGSPSARKGIVHGVSSSGATVFLEPMETIELNNELVEAREEEAAEIERVLAEWTGRLAGRREDLIEAARGIGSLDLALARAELAREQRAVRPEIAGRGGLRVTAARHPVLEQALGRRGGAEGRVVPLTLSLEPGERTLVISGPNAGGKTVALKTVGLLAVMAHCGLHVPAEEFELPPLRQILVDIGDRQSIAESLSTFSAHVTATAAMLRQLDPPALVLLDEVGTGTDPAEGVALATALLEHLMARGACCIVTTHHGALKAWAYATPEVANAAVEFDEQKLRPTYRLIQGVAGASSGLEIAARLGIDPGIIDSARSRVSADARQSEALLARLRDLLAQTEEDREEAGRLRALLEQERRLFLESSEADLRRRKESLEAQGARLLDELHRKSVVILSRVEERRERLKLERERAKREAELRQEVAEDMQRLGIGAAPGRPALVLTGPPRPGDRVFVASLKKEGVVEESDEEAAVVRIGSARMRVRLEECRVAQPRAGQDRPEPGVSLPAGVTAAFAPRENAPGEVMLLGLTVEEALSRLDKFLDDAFLSGRSEVRVIHGHGTGRLRGAVREFLSAHPHVESHRAGAATEGGTGATIAKLRS